MKSIKMMFLMVMAMTIVSSSCKKEEPPSELSVSPSSITVNAEKSYNTVSVFSNTNWDVYDIPSWIDVYPTSGSGNESVQLTIQENKETDERTAQISIASNDGSIIRSVRIAQNGKVVSLSVDVTSINLPSSANASQTINITCNSSWTVSGAPDWLQISSVSGNGNSSILISARDANESSSVRSATLMISSEGKSVSVAIQQEAGLSSCKAIPSNITSLWYAVIFNLTYSSEVALTKLMMLSDYDYKHMTEASLIAELEKEDAQIPEDETIYTRGVEEGKKYHILSLSYDKKGNRGELVDVEFESPEYIYSATDDAWCAFEDASYNSSLFWFDVKKKGRCTTYDVIYGANLPASYLRGTLMAFELNYFIKNKKKNWLAENWDLQIEVNYPNDNTFYCLYNPNSYYGGVIATVWGVFSDGKHSSDINTVSGDTFAESVPSMNGNKKSTKEIEWINNQKGWIKTTPKDLKK